MTTDSIADLLTRVRNAHNAGHKSVTVPVSKVNRSILSVLKEEGFIASFNEKKEAFGAFDGLEVLLKYYSSGEPVISILRRMSKPGKRVYIRHESLSKVENGLGIAIVSTSQGIMSDREARKKRIGGELLAQVA